MSMTTLTEENGMLALKTPYSPGLVLEIKSLPATERRWDPTRKLWLIAPRYANQVVDWVERHLGEVISAPRISQSSTKTELKTLEIRYLGTCKERTPGEVTAFGYCDGEWSVIFPEKVLRLWFEGFDMPAPVGAATTLYGVLGIPQNADPDAIKSAYRKAAKQWHPDVCKEPDAEQRFKRIGEAYQTLSNPNQRARYNAGLKLEATLKNQPARAYNLSPQNYRSPLLCGMVLAEGQYILGRFVVEKILMWEPITDAQGRTLCSSWPKGADHFQEVWS
jgi:hypothetical protein